MDFKIIYLVKTCAPKEKTILEDISQPVLATFCSVGVQFFGFLPSDRKFLQHLFRKFIIAESNTACNWQSKCPAQVISNECACCMYVVLSSRTVFRSQCKALLRRVIGNHLTQFQAIGCVKFTLVHLFLLIYDSFYLTAFLFIDTSNRM